MDRRREVHAEERQRRVGDGVDLPAHEVGAVGTQLQVGAAERHDAHVAARARAGGEHVRPRAAAGHGAPRREALPTDHELGAVRTVQHRPNGDARADLSTVGLDVARVGGGDGGEVDDPRLRRVQRREACRFGLDLADLGRPDAAQPRHAVLGRAPLELVEARQVGVAHRHDELPARLRLDPIRGAVLVQPVGARPAQLRLQRARLVVDALVDDAAVVRGLVRAQRRLALEHQHLAPAQRQLARRRQPDDAAADDRDVMGHARPRRSPAEGRGARFAAVTCVSIHAPPTGGTPECHRAVTNPAGRARRRPPTPRRSGGARRAPRCRPTGRSSARPGTRAARLPPRPGTRACAGGRRPA